MLFIACLGITPLWAQNAVGAAGGDASGNAGSSSYSVGQLIYSQINGSNGSVSQGVQQPYEILIVTGVEIANSISLDLSVFPNPTTDFLTLKLNNFDLSNLNYCLFDNNGKLIEDKPINTESTTIDLSGFHSAIYYLKVIQNNLEIKVFKIIKY